MSLLWNMLPGVGINALILLEGDANRQAAMAAGADDLFRNAELTNELLLSIRRVKQAIPSR